MAAAPLSQAALFGAATSGAKKPSLTLGDWWLICKACKFATPGAVPGGPPNAPRCLHQGEIDRLLPASVTSTMRRRVPTHADGVVTMDVFMEALVMVARQKYPEASMSVSVEQLLEEHIDDAGARRAL